MEKEKFIELTKTFLRRPGYQCLSSSVVWVSVEVLKAPSLAANGSKDPNVEVHTVRGSSAGLRGASLYSNEEFWLIESYGKYFFIASQISQTHQSRFLKDHSCTSPYCRRGQ